LLEGLLLDYAFFGFLAARAIDAGGTSRWPGFKIFWVAVFLTGIYALSDEFHQLFVVGRTASGFDVVADFIGGQKRVSQFWAIS